MSFDLIVNNLVLPCLLHVQPSPKHIHTKKKEKRKKEKKKRSSHSHGNLEGLQIICDGACEAGFDYNSNPLFNIT